MTGKGLKRMGKKKGVGYGGDGRGVDSSVAVLFFYGKSDWTVGPEHYKGVNFPNMLLWGSNVGHVPFMENKIDMEKAMDSYLKKFNL